MGEGSCLRVVFSVEGVLLDHGYSFFLFSSSFSLVSKDTNGGGGR